MRGFTIIELILVIAILAIVSVLAIPFVQSFQTTSDLSTYTDNITATLRRTQSQAAAGQNNDSWGVYFDNGNNQVISFKGQSYASRDQSFDLVLDYPEIFTISTDFNEEIYFSQYSGRPSASGTVQILSVNNDQKNILINGYGKIEISN